MKIQINSIEQLTEIILSDQFNDKQLTKIIETVFTVIFMNDLPPRKDLAKMVNNFYNEYSGVKEKPIFIDLDSIDVID